MSACAATQEAIWLKMLLEELHLNTSQPIVLKEDNVACIHFSRRPGDFKRTKHIDTRYHFVRERVKSADIILEQIDTSEQTADIFTKALENLTFKRHRDSMVKSKSGLRVEWV